jgi:hypothetical protein
VVESERGNMAVVATKVLNTVGKLQLSSLSNRIDFVVTE